MRYLLSLVYCCDACQCQMHWPIKRVSRIHRSIPPPILVNIHARTQRSVRCAVLRRRRSWCAPVGEPRIQAALANAMPSTHPGKETFETKSVAAMWGGAVSKNFVNHSSAHPDGCRTVKILTSSDQYTNSTALGQSPPARMPVVIRRSRPFSYCPRRFLPRLALGNPHSLSPSSPRGLSSYRKL